jgi:4-aminobutyrate aminotransferase-like enzyme
MGKTGIHENVLKIRPPMPFAATHADLLVDTLEGVLSRIDQHSVNTA